MAGRRAPGAAQKIAMIQALFEHSRDLMHVVSADGRYRLINPAWTEVLGWEEADLIGRPALDLAHPEDLRALGGR